MMVKLVVAVWLCLVLVALSISPILKLEEAR